MEAQERTNFISSYSKLLVAAWSDESVHDRLVTDPKGVLAQFGLSVPESANVDLVRQIPAQHGEADVDFQVRLWEKGLETCNFEMHTPDTPQIDSEELSDAELEAVAGGWSISCCCCTPCCSCA